MRQRSCHLLLGSVAEAWRTKQDRSALTSYKQILKATTLIGGAQAIGLLFGMVRAKVAALFIGPFGVGLLGNYQVIVGLVQTLSQMGLDASGAREIALAVSTNEDNKVAETAAGLRRICWLTATAGALLMIGSASLISELTFGSDKYVQDIRLLAVAVFMGGIAMGHMALIQGMRRIDDLARASIIGAAVGSVISIAFYWLRGVEGIVPALLIMSMVQTVISWWFSRKIDFKEVRIGWLECLRGSVGIASLGVAIMWTGLLGSLVQFFTRVLVTQEDGIAAAGIFGAAFALSGMFLNFILGAMGADYLPRLSGASEDHGQMRRLVNEQSEIGLLLALPGLMATLTFGPWIIQVFYTGEFLAAVPLLQWFVLGCVGRIIGWPMGYVVPALGKGRLFFVSQTFFHVLHAVLIFTCFHQFGLEGIAIAFFLHVVVGAAIVRIMIGRLIGFAWSRAMRLALTVVVPAIAIAFLIARVTPPLPALAIGAGVTAACTIACIRRLVAVIGREHRLVKVVFRVPLLGRIFGA